MNNTEILTKLLSGLSRSLNIANKVIPIYQDSKPLFKNVKNIYNIFKTPIKENKEPIPNEPIKKETIKKSPSNSPQFFI